MGEQEKPKANLRCHVRPGCLTYVTAVPLVIVLFILLMLGMRFVIEGAPKNLPIAIFILLVVAILIVIGTLTILATNALLMLTTRNVFVTPLLAIRMEVKLNPVAEAWFDFRYGALFSIFYFLIRAAFPRRFVLCEEGLVANRCIEYWNSFHSFTSSKEQSQIRINGSAGRIVTLQVPEDSFEVARQIVASHLSPPS